MRRKKVVAGVLLFSSLFFFGSRGVEAKAFIYPKTTHSVKEMYEKKRDYTGGNPGEAGNQGKAGKKGNSGKKGNPGKRGNAGKGSFVIVY